jgi:hypothetical protein
MNNNLLSNGDSFTLNKTPYVVEAVGNSDITIVNLETKKRNTLSKGALKINHFAINPKNLSEKKDLYEVENHNFNTIFIGDYIVTNKGDLYRVVNKFGQGNLTVVNSKDSIVLSIDDVQTQYTNLNIN